MCHTIFIFSWKQIYKVNGKSRELSEDKKNGWEEEKLNEKRQT